MIKIITKILLLVFYLGLNSVFGQAVKYYNYTFSDSSKTVGFVSFEDENVVQIKTPYGNEIRINKLDIINKEIADSVVIERYTTDNNFFFEPIKPITENTDTSGIVRLELKGGSTLIGRVDSEDSTKINFTLLSKSKIIIPQKSVLRRESVSTKIQNGEYWIEDPNTTRLFFASTGRGLKSGKGYFSVYEIFFPMVSFGMFDYITLSGGISLFPGSGNQLVYFAPKITPFQNEKYAISIGDFFVKYPSTEENLNILYSVATTTFSKGAVTLGVGYEAYSQNPFFLVGGELRISRHTKLITENWFIKNSEFNIISFGLRFLGEHLAADFAFVIPIVDSNDRFLIPYIGFAYNF